MIDLLTAIGLMFVLEGAMYALFPDGMRKMMEQLMAMKVNHIRMIGLFMACFGFLIVAVLRGF